MRKNRRDWDEGANVRNINVSYRTPTEEIMTLTEEQFLASFDILKHHRTITAIFTDIGLVVQPTLN